VIGGQAAWWTCVLLVRSGRETLALAGPAAHVAAHAFLRPAHRSAALALAAAGALAGFAGDSALVAAGLLEFPGAGEDAAWSRPWMAALWAALAVSLTLSLRRLLRGPVALAAALGAVAGPLAYLAGERLGVLALAPGPLAARALAGIAAEWFVAVALLVAVARRVVPAGRGADR
jgi:hypothetical protein